jgi:hypothetical protein
MGWIAKKIPTRSECDMTKENLPAVPQSTAADVSLQRIAKRRSFLKGLGVAGAALSASALLPKVAGAQNDITPGDAAILKFLAAAEIIESDLWLQYAELGGVQDKELPVLANSVKPPIPNYPMAPTGGSAAYMNALRNLDGDMPQYIHDNTEDELTHEDFINAYLFSKNAGTVNLDAFRTLPSSKATGANQIGRLTNLMQLTVDTTWWTRYRSRSQNPDFGDIFAPAIPSLVAGQPPANQHTAIPRTDKDLNNKDFLQAIANTAGFHFAFIEQGGSSLYPKLAQRVTSVEVLRILLSIGGTEICHFQTWHDKAGNAPALTNIKDPETKVTVTFPNLATPAVGEDLQANLIMPEPTVFLRGFHACSIIRPTETQGAAMGAVKALTDDGLFIGHEGDGFVEFLTGLAADADAAQRGV